MTDNRIDTAQMHFWVVEATIDLPVCFKMDADRSTAGIYISLGGEDPDGFVQIRPLDQERANSSVFWSASKPIVYECRALVRAPEAPSALMRGSQLFEHLADRLTLLVGYPVRVLTIGFVYDEDMLRQCMAGEILEYVATTGGESSFRTQLPKNTHWQQHLLIPPEAALEAMRWFRRGMTASLKMDQYLFYYIALESIARHVPGVTRGPRRNSRGEEEEGLESQESAAIRYLISRYPSFPPNARRVLADIRARIAHGNTDLRTLELASANLIAEQQLGSDGIALVSVIEPASFNVLEPSPVNCLAPLLRAAYSPEENPVKRWDGLLSDAFVWYLENAGCLEPQVQGVVAQEDDF